MKVIITGATGMVGKGVLLECIDDDKINQILLINRSPIGLKHKKIKEFLHKDFIDFSALQEDFKGSQACFHCMGVSSAGMNEEQYHKLTYTISEALANTLFDANPSMTFIYVSGEGTDSTEKGNTMWARVKGKTENYIFNKGFKDAYAFRPGVILPKRGVKSKTKLYHYFYVISRPFFPLMERIKSVTTTEKLGQAMIALVKTPQEAKVLSGKDINEVAKQSKSKSQE